MIRFVLRVLLWPSDSTSRHIYVHSTSKSKVLQGVMFAMIASRMLEFHWGRCARAFSILASSDSDVATMVYCHEGVFYS